VGGGGHDASFNPSRVASGSVAKRRLTMLKLVLEILISAILHPIAVVLMWINLAGRTDINRMQKVIWAIVGLIWGIGPILYILVGDGVLW
jgi:hypothetical protein